jgi:hypothetical protein
MLAAFVGVGLALVPFAVSAASVADIETQVMQVLGQVAALEAQASGNSVACVVVTSAPSVSVGQPFAIIWNTFGAKDPSNADAVSQFARGGISTVTLDKPGTYKYDFVFYGASGGQAKCTALISVKAAQ